MKKHNDSRPTKKQAQKWADALRSGKYKQGRCQLQSEDGYCCLGVACDVFIKRKDMEFLYGRIHGCLPHQQPNAPKWLKAIVGSYFYFTCEEEEYYCSLEDMNDMSRCTFDMIADIIELEYVHFTE